MLRGLITIWAFALLWGLATLLNAAGLRAAGLSWGIISFTASASLALVQLLIVDLTLQLVSGRRQTFGLRTGDRACVDESTTNADDQFHRAFRHFESTQLGTLIVPNQIKQAIDDATRALDAGTDELAYRIRAIAYAIGEQYAASVADLKAAADCISNDLGSRDSIALTEFYTDDLEAKNPIVYYTHAANAIGFLHKRAETLFDVSDYPRRIAALVNLSAAATPGGRYADVPLYRICTARILLTVINQCMQGMYPVSHHEWTVASTAVGRLGLLALSGQQRSAADRFILNLALTVLRDLHDRRKSKQPAAPTFFALSVLSAMSLFENVSIKELLSEEGTLHGDESTSTLATESNWFGAARPSDAIKERADMRRQRKVVLGAR
jgi:hypothetical protein